MFAPYRFSVAFADEYSNWEIKKDTGILFAENYSDAIAILERYYGNTIEGIFIVGLEENELYLFNEEENEESFTSIQNTLLQS